MGEGFWSPRMRTNVERIALRRPGVIREKPLTSEPLYSTLATKPEAVRPAGLVFIPYYAWENREPTEMQVWVRHR